MIAQKDTAAGEKIFGKASYDNLMGSEVQLFKFFAGPPLLIIQNLRLWSSNLAARNAQSPRKLQFPNTVLSSALLPR